MKQLSAILVFFLFIPICSAQSRITSRLPQDHNVTGEVDMFNSGFGLKAGYTHASLRGTGIGSLTGGVQPLPAFHAGIFSQFPLGNSLSLQPELLFSRQGYQVSSPGNTGGMPPGLVNYAVLRLDYINLPVLIVYNLSYRWSLHAGPQTGLLVTVKEDGREISQELYRALDLGAAGGTEFRFARFRIGGRYVHGFRDVRTQTPQVRNYVLQVYTGFSFFFSSQI
jgi:hypothetical protein